MSNAFEEDVKHAAVLGQYVRAWGMPDGRTVSRKDGRSIEVYSFPGSGERSVTRYATVGLSCIPRMALPESPAGIEFLLVVPSNNAGAAREEVVRYLLDVAAYSLRPDVAVAEGCTIPDSPLAPPAWAARALLFDKPRGEAEELESLEVAADRVNLWWLIPIHEIERQLILNKGISEFDAAAESSDWSLVDPARPSFVSSTEGLAPLQIIPVGPLQP